MIGRDDVEGTEPRDPVRLVKRHAKADAGAAVVTGKCKGLETQFAHDVEGILPHRAEGIGSVVRTAIRLRTVAVTAQIHRNDGECLGERGAMQCQLTWVNGFPWMRSNGGPSPAMATLISAPVS